MILFGFHRCVHFVSEQLLNSWVLLRIQHFLDFLFKETIIFLTHIGDLSLRVLYYTPLGIPGYENH
jgi:hypothetical protein